MLVLVDRGHDVRPTTPTPGQGDDREREGAYNLLRITAEFAPEQVPLTLFTANSDLLPPALAAAAADALKFAEAASRPAAWLCRELSRLAHSRAGDKGTIATLSVVPHDDADYPRLVRELTAQRVRTHLGPWVGGQVTRYELPRICSLQFVCTGIRRGGVTVSPALDTHGRSLSSRLLTSNLP